jgi:hypothetical protein
LVRAVHVTAAAALFLVMAYFCMRLFTKSAQPNPTTQKKKRNKIYPACGWCIIACIVLSVATNLLSTAARNTYRPLLWCETLAVLAFGLAWMTKGETLFRDSQSAPPTGSNGGDDEVQLARPPLDAGDKNAAEH